LLLDDEIPGLTYLKFICEEIPHIEVLRSFNDPIVFLKDFKKYNPDFCILDIEMPDKNGFELLKSINQDVIVIFTTAYSKYAVEGFEVNAIDYLLKPIELDRFKIACKKANDFFEFLANARSKIQNCLYVRSEYALIKILFSEIRFLETMDDYIKIHTTDGKTILTLMSMKKILEKLPNNDFIRVHRSFAVSLSTISSIRNKTIYLGETAIPLGTNYTKEVQKIISSKK
jgi:DNA-binding LytR/AlgR family response regulator